MKVFTTDSFNGHWPVGTAAVVVAETQQAAYDALMAELGKQKLSQEDHWGKLQFHPSDMIELDTTTPSVNILCNGDY